MSRARTTFFERLVSYENAVDQELIVTKTPSDAEHNARARLFRAGLAVVAFALVEDFIKLRTGEVIQRVGDGVATFADLPQGLRIAATAGVSRALNYQGRFLDSGSSSYLSHYQEHSSLIASTRSTSFQISPLAFGSDQPNLSAKAIEDILTAFHINQPWNAIGSVARRSGVGVPALREAFVNATSRRHEAAHRADADVEPSNLKGFVAEALGIALGVDLSLSLAVRKILDGDNSFLTGNQKIAGNRISVRLIKFDGSKWWRETVPGRPRAIARKESFEDLKLSCFQRARSNHEGVIVQNTRGLPSVWHTPFVD